MSATTDLRWHGCDADGVSFAWEAAHGYDSIATIERVYERTPAGAYVCMTPGCVFARRDPERLWRHIHTAHGRDDLPPESFDPGPWL